MSSEKSGQGEQHPPDVSEFWPFLTVAVASVGAFTLGQFTGHYVGWYAQTDTALLVQVIIIGALIASMFVSVWRADYAA